MMTFYSSLKSVSEWLRKLSDQGGNMIEISWRTENSYLVIKLDIRVLLILAQLVVLIARLYAGAGQG